MSLCNYSSIMTTLSVGVYVIYSIYLFFQKDLFEELNITYSYSSVKIKRIIVEYLRGKGFPFNQIDEIIQDETPPFDTITKLIKEEFRVVQNRCFSSALEKCWYCVRLSDYEAYSILSIFKYYIFFMLHLYSFNLLKKSRNSVLPPALMVCALFTVEIMFVLDYLDITEFLKEYFSKNRHITSYKIHEVIRYFYFAIIFIIYSRQSVDKIDLLEEISIYSALSIDIIRKIHLMGKKAHASCRE